MVPLVRLDVLGAAAQLLISLTCDAAMRVDAAVSSGPEAIASFSYVGNNLRPFLLR